MNFNYNQSGDDNPPIEVDKDPTPGSPSPTICASEDYQFACTQFARLVQPDDKDAHIRRSLGLVYQVVKDLLSQDQQFFGRVATSDEYETNVKHFGEDRFIGLLKNTVEKDYWTLFQHSAVYNLYLTRTY